MSAAEWAAAIAFYAMFATVPLLALFLVIGKRQWELQNAGRELKDMEAVVYSLAPDALLGIGNANESEGLIEAGGWFGLATAAAAWYASFAAVTNSTFGRTGLPVKPTLSCSPREKIV